MAQLEPTEILAAHTLIDAAKCLKGASNEHSTHIIEKAIDIYSRNGKFDMSAKYMKNIAESYDDSVNYKAAIKYYLKAAELFELEKEESMSSTQTLQKAADLTILHNSEKLIEAIPVFFMIFSKNRFMRKY